MSPLSPLAAIRINSANLSRSCIHRESVKPIQGEYRPRNPVSTPLYKIVEDYWELFINSYDDKFQEKYGFFRPVVESQIKKYLDCGILRNGFIRIRCPDCKEEYLLPFSCKDRCLCPSCTAKRSISFAEFIVHEVIEPVPHRHLVFSLPKIIRPYFKFNRKLIALLSRCAYDSVREICQPLFEESVMPGMIIAVQTFSDDLGWHPHLHALMTDGVFDENGNFHPLEHLSLSYIKNVFEHKVLFGLRKKELISEETIKLIQSWQHTGFHVYHETHISAGDTKRLEQVASYLIRPPVSLERLSYNDQNAVVTYRGKRDIYDFHPITFLALVSLHIANHGEQMVRYYGWYSNKKRGMREKEGMVNKLVVLQEDLTDYQKSCRKGWARLIRKIYEVDPLVCPKCGAKMKIVSAIEDDMTIQKILSHQGLLNSRNRSPPPPIITTPWEKEFSYSPLTKGDGGGCYPDYIPEIEVYCRDM